MARWMIVTGAMLTCASTMANAQSSARANDPVFARAQALVSDGNGAAGRALIDSVIATTPTGAPLYPQALFWRASLASNAADAESDYRHIVVDYPLAPQAEDALLRLAQLELARGDKDAALTHLQRIQRDYPRSKSLARASYWTARVLFEKNDVQNACAANAKALAQADSGEIELRNQIQYQGQRCPSVVTADANTHPPDAANQNPVSTDSATKTRVSSPKIAPPAQANDAKPSIVDPAKGTAITEKSITEKAATAKPAVTEKPTTITEKPAAKAATANSPTGGYSVQVAAYNHKADADKLASSLIKRGYAARVDGTVAPFRVRIGRFTTNADAEDALKRIKSKHMEGFVARVSER
jgi:cell division protein FtsN